MLDVLTTIHEWQEENPYIEVRYEISKVLEEGFVGRVHLILDDAHIATVIPREDIDILSADNAEVFMEMLNSMRDKLLNHYAKGGVIPQ